MKVLPAKLTAEPGVTDLITPVLFFFIEFYYFNKSISINLKYFADSIVSSISVIQFLL